MAFFLGRKVGSETDDGGYERVEYEPKHLTTHGLVFGMTGSGKTGLCVGILEEASRHDIPIIAIDPKGDLTNLALSWPSMAPEHFAKWVDPSKLEGGVDAAALGRQTAEMWAKGIGRDGQSGETIHELRSRTGITIYTPGSTAGVPVSMLSRFDAPPGFNAMTNEDQSEQISGVVSALLALVDIDADPLQSEEFILLANILAHAWGAGQALDLPAIIKAIYEPPFTTMGVFDLEEFFPQRKRKDFAMQLNALIASPSFKPWLTGAPLDMNELLARDERGSRTSIFYIAHLDDAERMSFVSLLLDKLIAWMRTQSGTGDLRALLYMDEVFGYLPPYPRNPPTKRPLLTIMKQARAFGVGALLATQNPVDVDYKAITNAGTWLIGKLQTDQDKDRILDGLMSSAAGEGAPSRADISRAISALQSRQFLLQNAHDTEQVTFSTRWVLSYLRGPMTRQEISRLKDVNFYNLPSALELTPLKPPPRRPEPRRQAPAPAPTLDPDEAVVEVAPRRGSPPVVEAHIEPTRPSSLDDLSASMITIDRDPPAKARRGQLSGVDQRFLTSAALRMPAVRSLLRMDALAGIGPVHYRPALMARARLTFKVGDQGELAAGTITRVVFPVPETPGAVGWLIADAPIADAHLSEVASEPCEYHDAPDWLQSASARERAKDLFVRTLIDTRRAAVPVCPPLNRIGEPGETLDTFRARLATLLTAASERARDKMGGRRDVEVAIWENQIDEMKELLEMDKRELTILAQQGDADALERARDRTRFRMERYKELKATRDKILGEVDRDMADVEFSAIDKLEACKLVELELTPKGITSAFFGVLWVPNR